jgi:hypothetical protein
MNRLVAVTSLLLCAALVCGDESTGRRRGGRPGNRRGSDDTAIAAAAGVCREPRIACQLNCGAAGFRTNRAGCPVCMCRRVAACPAIACPDMTGVCPFGRARNENGCALCECAAPPRNCSTMALCRRVCPEGFRVNDAGCPICECYEAPPTATLTASRSPQCGNISCLMECPNGRRAGPDGCPMCQCQPASDTADCTPVRCRNNCAFGRHKDSRGCDTCACARRSTRPISRPALSTASVTVNTHADDDDDDATDDDDTAVAPGPLCPMCMMYCPHGMEKDERGCPVCRCNEHPVPVTPRTPVRRGQGQGAGGHGRGRGVSAVDRVSRTRCLAPTCMMFCPHGFNNDSNGCAICSCREPASLSATNQRAVSIPQPPADAISCRPVRCRNHCAFGYHVNAAGCQTCLCKSEADSSPDTRTGALPELCSLPAVVGHCRAAHSRWYFSAASGQCETFTYGGCGGNANNFRSEDDCKAACHVE